ncbi:hypothetical protein ACH5RR_007352 [Cinchona calisaya]|uniref:GDSL esterase/lipase n=1 Tax=Cinchona calisaya TaxID=153742 RepID=A0ABD3ARP5_9GENT
MFPMMMESPKLLISFFFLFSIFIAGQNARGGVNASARLQQQSLKDKKQAFQAKKLFVFGDSYADTGNSEYEAASWKQPYGITYPGHPSGRYSDGRLLTDFLAKFYGLETPTAYRFIKDKDDPHLQYGVNFAYGGTGAFATGEGYPNLADQIDLLNKYLKDSVINKSDLETSLSFLSVNGNDYTAYYHQNGTTEGLPSYIFSVVEKIAKNMESLHELGARKIAVSGMPPQDCIPEFAQSVTECNEILNIFVSLHNFFLKNAVSRLNTESGDSSYHILDLNSAFKTVFNSSTRNESRCGNVDSKGQPLYKVCNDRKSAFYWDEIHPTQAGWRAAYDQALKHALEEIN